MIGYMHELNIAGLDLNLVPALDALLRHRNVTRAAERLSLSQPALSHALNRLRQLLNDQLSAAKAKAPGDDDGLVSLLRGSDTWTVS